jgi:hypothetical protein
MNLERHQRRLTRAMFMVLGDIEASARATAVIRNNRISANNLGRVLGFRLGLTTLEGQRLAKQYRRRFQ